MTTTPQEPGEDPEVVPSGDPSTDPQPVPETDPIAPDAPGQEPGLPS
jgi:hypothetical protein